ncbi:MAG: phosphate acyltransferase PlsX [Firmicutes bacterium]|nr:phosphate acyltransferase PlsX [Bacillota bacterium]
MSLKIVLDCNGGDHGTVEAIKGAVEALKENPKLELVLVGVREEIETLIKESQYTGGRYEIIDGEKINDTEDNPTAVFRQYPNSSVVVSFSTAKTREDVGAVVSAGSTGTVLTAAVIKLGRQKGIKRPTLMVSFPTVTGGKVLLTDCGANVDSTSDMQVQWALLANAYAKRYMRVENPRIGLLNVGVEENKGDLRAKEVFGLLKARTDINFTGNMESREFITGAFDIIVADGFAGNVLMKSTEGTGMAVGKLLKGALMKNIKTKIGALLIKSGLKPIRKMMDYTNFGGANFLGCQKLVVKCHGSSKAKSIRIAILETYDVLESGVLEDIKAVAAEFAAEGANE